MRQVQIDRFGGPEEMYVAEAPEPSPGPGEVVVRVEVAGVNPIDHKIRDGSSGVAKKLTEADFPYVLGRECCGVVTAVGEGADLEVGQRVFGCAPMGQSARTYAEFTALPADSLAVAPDGSDPRLLGGAPVAALTAWIAVHDQARVQPGDTVLVHGAGGGVGQWMVQLARDAGAQVWGTASAEKADRVRELGATPVDYRSQDWREVVPPCDVILDGVYFDTFEPSLDHLKPGGRIVVLPTLADLTPARERGIEAHTPGLAPSRERLERIAAGLADGSLTAEVSEAFPLDRAAEAHRTVEAGHTRGKVVLDLR